MRFSILLLSLLVTLQTQKTVSQNFFQRVAKFAGRGGKKGGLDGEIPTATLSNGVVFPLIGVGVGNMYTGFVPAIVGHAVRPDNKIHLIDTSMVSENGKQVAQGIIDGADHLVKSEGGETKVLEVHVVTKVWYTHLGYERTMLAVKSYIEDMKLAMVHPNVDLKLHVLINWPRCYDSVSWMDCEEDEKDLPDAVKQAGPSPHLDPENAWKGSWKALETLYEDKSAGATPLASIGVSNFHLDELKTLMEMATVKPHIVQTNAWSLLHDPLMVDYCHQQKIQLSVYNLMAGILGQAEDAAFAFHHLLALANIMSKELHDSGALPKDVELTAPQILLAWMIQHSISVSPRTTRLSHLHENSVVALANIPTLNDEQLEIIATSVEALISGVDMDEDAHVKLTFEAKNKDVYLYWHDQEFGGEIQVALIEQGDTFEESSHPGHTFRIYDSEDKSNYQLYKVEGRYGDHHHVEL